MKEEPPTYDSFCLEDECYHQRSAFFKFNMHSNHILEGHEVKEIHPMTFFHILRAGDRQKCFSDDELVTSVEKVHSVIEVAVA
jgi:hypothetical protein